jgi:hypothetical protein
MVNTVTQKPDSQLIQKANEFVNQAFWGSMLREFRSGREPTILDGGPGSTTFVRQLDMELLKRVSQKGNTPLAQALLRQLDPNGIKRGLKLSQSDNSYQHNRTTSLKL